MKKKGVFNKLKKILLVIMCAITLFFSMPKKSEASIVADLVDLLLRIPDGIMGILNENVSGVNNTKTWLKIDLKGISNLGDTETEGRLYNFEVTPFDIFTSGRVYKTYGFIDETNANNPNLVAERYIKIPMLDINFFRDFYIDNNKDGVNDIVGDSANILRPTVASVYKALRNIVLVLMLVILLYVGIRIIIASAVTDQVKYKQWLVDWVVGICLLLVMQYVMSFCMNINEIILEILGADNAEEKYYISLSNLGGGDGYSDWRTVVDTADTRATDEYIGFSPEDIAEKYGKTFDAKVSYFYNNHIDVAREKDKDGNYVIKYYEPYNLDGTKANIDNGFTGYFRPHTKYNIWGDENGLVFINARIYYEDDGEFNSVEVLTTIGGVAAGATIGSLVCPGLGTAAGGLLGGLLGWAVGDKVTSDEDVRPDTAIYKGNTVEYIRTLTTFGTKYVRIYRGNGVYTSMSESNEVDYSDGIFAGYAILYIILVAETLMFLYTYIKRVFKLAFYTMIAPLIAFMYPIDKLGDGKAQAFNTWFKEYLFNILIQPLHLLLYTIFIYSAMDLMNTNIIYGIGAYAYMIAAEKFFKKIFGFDKHASGSPGLANPMAGGMAMRGFDRLGKFGPFGRNNSSGSGSDRKHGKVKLAKEKPTISGAAASGGTPFSAGGESELVGNTPNSAGNARFGRNMTTGLSGGRGMSPSSAGVGGAMPSAAPGLARSNSSAVRKRGMAGAMLNSLGSRAAMKITGGKTSSMGAMLKGHKLDAAKNIGSRAGKGALRLAGRGVGAAAWGAAGLMTGVVASALSGENQLGKGLGAGLAIGWNRGGNLANKAIDWGEGLSEDARISLAKENPDVAADVRWEKLVRENPDAMSHLTSTQESNLHEALKYGDIAPDDVDTALGYIDKFGDIPTALDFLNYENKIGDLGISENMEKAVDIESQMQKDADGIFRYTHVTDDEKLQVEADAETQYMQQVEAERQRLKDECDRSFNVNDDELEQMIRNHEEEQRRHEEQGRFLKSDRETKAWLEKEKEARRKVAEFDSDEAQARRREELEERKNNAVYQRNRSNARTHLNNLYRRK